MAKEVLRRAGLPVPDGRLAATPDEAAAAAAGLGPVAVKAQVLTGGRGKAGGIALAGTPDAARAAAARILGMDIRGYRVEQVYCEQRVDIDRELYVAIAIDASRRCPVLIASSRGGIDIEEVDDREIVRLPVEARWGLQPFLARDAALGIGLPAELVAPFAEVACGLYRVFAASDAELVECNPLAVSAGALVCADARLNVDDDAVSAHSELPRTSEATPLEARVRALGLSFVELDGDIAVMANGAGITMATLDVLRHFGGRARNFLDAGGGAGTEPTAQALDILLATRPKAVFINIFGGITRCDEVANAIAAVVESRGGLDVPAVVRLVGTNESEGTAILAKVGIAAYTSMRDAARAVVAAAAGTQARADSDGPPRGGGLGASPA